MLRIAVIDSHTAGEPTRVVLPGEIVLTGETMTDRREDFRCRLDHLRSGILNEPRGSDVIVGAVLTPPISPGAVAGIVFFNNVGYLGMCGHGTIGVVETLRHLGKIGVGSHLFDTPVGPVGAEIRADGSIAIRNVPSRRYLSNVSVEVEGEGVVRGDIAYGGNWFFIVKQPSYEIDISRAPELSCTCDRIRISLEREGIEGENGGLIDHIELCGEPKAEGAHSRNFVICPGGAYDRSPCGTGTSAKLACLYADGKLLPGQTYVQESVIGTSFAGSVEPVEGGVIPTIVGRAYVTSEAKLLFSDHDPLRWGIRS